MAGSFEKSVKGGTKIKLAAPKAKYVDNILNATRTGEAGIGEVFRTLDLRLRDPSWTIAFKALIIVHLMIREGAPDATLRYLSSSPRRVAVSGYAEVQTQGRNIQHYAQYMVERAKSFRKAQFDYVREGEARLKKITVNKGLLWETECVQNQIGALLKCDLLTDEMENEITVTAFRLLTMDLLALFSALNQGAINVLEHYFEMSKPDAERALNIYKTFSRQTEEVVRFLAVARQFEHATKLEIPKIRHAPTGLANSLEDYLHDKDFEINRRQYLAQQDAKKNSRFGGSNKVMQSSQSSQPTRSNTTTAAPILQPASAAPTKAAQKGPPPDLIDFFESIEQNQQPMAQAPNQAPAQYQQPAFQTQYDNYTQVPHTQGSMNFQQQPQQQVQTGYPQAQNTFGQPQQPFSPIHSDYTGAGFGGYGPQPTQTWQQQPSPPAMFQNSQETSGFQAPQQQVQTQSTNPFRQSTMSTMTGAAYSQFSSPTSSTPTYSASNPFARTAPSQNMGNQMSQTPPLPSSPQAATNAAFGQPQRTGTNPFARGPSPITQLQKQATNPFQSAPVINNATGSTNPFRQSAFVNQQTGQGWQSGNPGTMGGLEQFDTVPVFPRPGQPQQTQPQSWR